MVTIREYYVADPPTGGELQEQAIAQLAGSGVLPLVLEAAQEVPPIANRNVQLKIRRTEHPRGGGMTISGETDTGDSIIVRAYKEPGERASARIVTPDED